MAKKSVHTVPGDKGWKNVQDGKDISSHRTKENAEQAGRQQAKRDHTEHVVHNGKGQISKKNSYGNDPCPPKDKK